jgi:hypothetical protein
MDQQEIDDELATTGAQELLASTSAAHLAYRVGARDLVPLEEYAAGSDGPAG